MSREKLNTTQRALRILKALKGRSLTGLTNKELCEAIGETPVNVTRALALLETEGFVQKLDTGAYALSVQCLQIAVTYYREMQKQREHIDLIDQRVQAGSW
ncbi:MULTISPECIES: helix-turn-helix domain-containing protein [Actinobacillus]|uniref:helix-turn-helix domain-containing protein n=1 Tax=Actinobacillus TaxID=713 RepID=UPI00037B65A9|nr:MULTISPECIES: helix-turn-helix domain-containing protein [Actinobacillus]WGE51153.1 helix-turn-helix domain-containing protein [Actinobacillus equuli subsp. haemolyticus]WGE65602.1 helix-turn-helix domain-containing protein [Actinobacillus equuli subsp. equuli]WGE83696.1 helix-turn-helix domain-containing protein [Actinobacillus equuli subsp. equuli]